MLKLTLFVVSLMIILFAIIPSAGYVKYFLKCKKAKEEIGKFAWTDFAIGMLCLSVLIYGAIGLFTKENF